MTCPFRKKPIQDVVKTELTDKKYKFEIDSDLSMN